MNAIKPEKDFAGSIEWRSYERVHKEHLLERIGVMLGFNDGSDDFRSIPDDGSVTLEDLKFASGIQREVKDYIKKSLGKSYTEEKAENIYQAGVAASRAQIVAGQIKEGVEAQYRW